MGRGEELQLIHLSCNSMGWDWVCLVDILCVLQTFAYVCYVLFVNAGSTIKMRSYVTRVLKLLKTYVGLYKDEWLPVLALFVAGVGVRILLIGENWPHVNLDEGVMGEMALDVAYH